MSRIDSSARHRICITGAAGRLGRYVVRALQQDHDLVPVDRIALTSEPNLVLLDILDGDELRRALVGVDTVVHLAAIDGSVLADDTTIFSTNVLGTWSVLHACAGLGIRRVVLCSSNAALGFNRPDPALGPLYLPVDEAHPCRPSSSYGLSKYLCEEAARSFAREHQMDILCLRPTYIMFPEIEAMVCAAQATSPSKELAELDLRNDSDAIPRRNEPLPLLGGYIRPEDAAKAFALGIKVTWSGFLTLFISAPDTFFLEPTATVLERAYGKIPELRNSKRFDSDPYASVYDTSAAAGKLGWHAQRRWDRNDGAKRA